MNNQDQNGRPLLVRIVGIGLCAFFVLALLASNAIPSRDGSIDSPTASTLSGPDDNSEDSDEPDYSAANPLTGRTAPDTSRESRESDQRNDVDDSGDSTTADESDGGDQNNESNTRKSDDSDTQSDANNQPKSAAGAPGNSGAQQAASRAAGRPMFELPFPCGQDWELTTYAGHDPDDSKVDFFSDGGTTDGAQVVSSAGGTVMKLPDPGGVKIDHGGGWYTLYLHMENIQVSVGQDVKQGDPIGHIGTAGTEVAHLHYEQLYNPSGGQAFTDPNITLPKFGDKKVRLVPDTDYPTMTSNNSCN